MALLVSTKISYKLSSPKRNIKKIKSMEKKTVFIN